MRSYLHVDDVADAFDVILHHGKNNEIYNIATEIEKSTLDVAKDILEIYNRSLEDGIIWVKDRPFNDFRYFLDNTKLQALGWEPKVSWKFGFMLFIL